MYSFIVFHIPVHLLRINFRIGGDKKQRFFNFFQFAKKRHLLVRKPINNRKVLTDKVKSVNLLYFARFTNIIFLKLSVDHEL